MNPLKVFNYKGTKLVDGLFQMHDQEGFSLADSLVECRNRGMVPCIKQFKGDALRAGWNKEKIDRVIAEAKADSR